MKGPKTLALVVSGFVVLATGFAFADQLTTQNISVSEEETTTSTEATTTSTTATTVPEAEHETETEHTRSTVGCPEGFTGNHGQFVSSVAKSDDDHDKVVEAAHSQCGKPEHEAGDDHDADDDAEHEAGDDHDGDHHGPSSNAGPSSTSGSDDGGSHHGHGHGSDD